MFVSAGIVTYNPNILKLKVNIESICNQVEHIYIYDNGSLNYKEVVALKDTYGDKISIIFSSVNKGIAFALNRVCESAIRDGFKWILTLDQDSECPYDLIENLTPYANSNVAVIGPKIVYRYNENFQKQEEDIFSEVEWLITSASLTNLDVYQEIEGFDEWLFIDKVDYDYCIRAHRAGYFIIQVSTTKLIHELGRLKCKRLLWRTVYVTNHPSFRYYYMARNALYIYKKLKVGSPYKYLLKLILKITLWEEDKLPKLKAIINGINSKY